MSFLNEITVQLKDYDLIFKAVAAVAAPGGIWFWVDKYRNRIRIKVRAIRLPRGDTSTRGITFEAENISSVLTSFEPEFSLTGYSPERVKQTYTFMIDGTDRQLPPHVLKTILGTHNDVENRIMIFLWFMTFKLQLSRGRPVRIRLRNADFEQVGFFRFHWERLLFLCFGRLP